MSHTTPAIRQCLHFGFKLQWNASETAEHIQAAYGKDAVSVRTAQDWFKKFREGKEDLEDALRSGRPFVIADDQLNALIKADPRQSLRDLAAQLGCSYGTVQSHIHALGKVRKLDQWVPHQLTEDNKLQRLTICSSLLSRWDNDPFLDRILTCDEKWVSYNNVKRCFQWLDPEEAPHQVPKPDLHPKKLLLSVWWTAAGLVRYEILEPGQTINAKVYCKQLQQVQKDLLHKQPAMVNRRGVLLLHDNARPHIAKKTRKKLTKFGWEMLPHPPYSPDISPTDYYLFRSLEHFLQNKRMNTRTEVENELKLFFDHRDTAFYRAGIEKLVDRWLKVVDVDGDYFVE
jgi:histone-lysine N-methyltransferase SETMAR